MARPRKEVSEEQIVNGAAEESAPVAEAVETQPAPNPEVKADPPPPAPKQVKPPKPGKFRCVRCQHQFESTAPRPACPQGCRYPLESPTRFGDYVTSEKIEA